LLPAAASADAVDQASIARIIVDARSGRAVQSHQETVAVGAAQ
jgi:hypothetical protein